MNSFLSKQDIWNALPVSKETLQQMLKEFIENDTYDKLPNPEDDMVVVGDSSVKTEEKTEESEIQSNTEKII